jgi:hypothetical protein
MHPSALIREIRVIRGQKFSAIFDLEPDSDAMRHYDRRANENFLLLDALEAEDAKTKST